VAVLILAATIGPKALYLLFAWLLGAAIGCYLSERKGWGQKPGLASGLFLSLLGAVIWLIWPAREGSDWKIKGPWGDKRKRGAPAA
jgi:hypothetical protein